MKRRIEAVDRSLIETPAIIESIPDDSDLKDVVSSEYRDGIINGLKRLQKLEEDVENRILMEKRQNLPIKTEVQLIQKSIRVFVRHTYHPVTSTTEESLKKDDLKGYFTIWIEGITSKEGSSTVNHGLANCFDRIYIEIDKKQSLNVFSYDWKGCDQPEGYSAEMITVKIPMDKNCSARICLYLANDYNPKYTISNEKLRSILSQIICEASEEDIVNALITYIVNNNLLSPHDGRYFRCDDILKEVFGSTVDSMLISNIRSKLLANCLILPYPVVFDLQLNTINTVEYVQNIVR
jgi:chromatin remodeling complex protein RSC6